MRALLLAAAITVGIAMPSISQASESTYVPLCAEVVSGQVYGTTDLPCATPTKGDNYAVTVQLPDGSAFTTKNFTPVTEELWEGAYVATGYMIHDRLPDLGPITEDDPRWDCETMGNRICGTKGSRPMVSGER